MATRTVAAAGGNWSATTTWVEAAVPTAADDVVAAASSGNLTIDVAASCRSLDCTGYVGVLTHNAGIVLSVGDGSGGALKFVAGMTYTLGSVTTSSISFVSTSNNGGAGWNVTWGGKTAGNITFNGAGGKWVLQDAMTIGATATLTLTNGIWDTTGQTCSWGKLALGAGTKTLTLGASTLTITGTGTSCDLNTNSAGLTFNANTSAITCNGAGITFSGGGQTYASVSLTGSGQALIQGSNTFTNLTRTGTAVQTDSLSLAIGTTQTITGTLTLNGNSVANRLRVFTGTRGSAATLNAATVSASNVNFTDVTAAGAANWNLSAITGNSGNEGGCTGITFTAAQTQYWSSGTGNYSNVAKWFLGSGGTGGAGRVPLPQDTARFDASSFTAAGQTITLDQTIIGSLDFTGATNNPALNFSVATQINGYITLASGMTTTGTSTPLFVGRLATHTITSNGVTFNPDVTIFCGTYQLGDNFVVSRSGAGTFTCFSTSVATNSFDAKGFNVTCFAFVSSGTTTRTITMGSGTWTLSGTGTVWNVVTTGLTLASAGSTITISDTSVTAKTFTGGGGSYAALTLTGGGTGAVTIQGSNTFTSVTVSTGPKSVTFTAGTSQTISSALTLTGSAANLITVRSSTSGSTYTLRLLGGPSQSLAYVDFKDAISSSQILDATNNGTDSGNNSNIAFTADQLAALNAALLAKSATNLYHYHY